jgi:hypothetical protein
VGEKARGGVEDRKQLHVVVRNGKQDIPVARESHWVWAGAVAQYCFGHFLVAVRRGQRRDAVATGEEQLGRCTTGKS